MARKNHNEEAIAAAKAEQEARELAWINGWPRRALDIMYYLTQYAEDIGLRINYNPVQFQKVLRDGTIEFTIHHLKGYVDHEQLSEESGEWDCEEPKRLIDEAKAEQDKRDERERMRREVIEKLTPEERELLGVRA